MSQAKISLFQKIDAATCDDEGVKVIVGNHYYHFESLGPPCPAQGIIATVLLYPLRCQHNRIEHLKITTTIKVALPSKGSDDSLVNFTFVLFELCGLCDSSFNVLFERMEINNVVMSKAHV